MKALAMNQYRNAAIRIAIAAVIVAAWVIWYDGPGWAWALLAAYAAFSFGVAHFIQGKVDSALARKEQDE